MNNNINSLLISTRKEIWYLLENYYNLTNLEFSRLKYEYEYYFGNINEKIEYYKKLESKINYKKKNTEPTKFINTSFCLQQPISCDNPNKSDEHQKNKTNYDNIRKYYRDLVKHLHPDVTNISYEFADFWYQIQDSYQSSDEFRLELYWRTIINKVEDKVYDSENEKIFVINNEINDLNFKIQQIKKNTRDLYLKEPYIFADKINDRFWIISHRRELETKLYSLKKKLINLDVEY